MSANERRVCETTAVDTLILARVQRRGIRETRGGLLTCSGATLFVME
jgi:hypothetical protein